MTARAGAAAIVLAGGRASRLDGIDKPQLVVGGSTLLDHAVSAVSWCDPIVIVGPTASVGSDPAEADRADAEVLWTRETPAFGGPVAAIAAGLALVEREEVCILSADTPHAVAAVALLREYALGDADAVCLADEAGRVQWLMGRYRTKALRAALGALPDAGRNASIRSLVSGLRLDVVTAGHLAADVDTWDDLERARAGALTAQHSERITDARRSGDDMTDQPQHLPVEALEEWTIAACARLNLDRSDVDVARILDLARDVAHGVARPAAPLSAFLAGLAAGRAGGSTDAADAASAAISDLAAGWRAAEKADDKP